MTRRLRPANARVVVPLCVAVLGLGSWLVLRALNAPSSELEQLRSRFARTVAGVRPVEGRLSWDLPHTAFEPDTATRSGAELSVDRLEARLGLYRLAREEASPASLAAAAIVDLFEGDAAAAVARLERAVELVGPDDPAVLSDLAAAYLARASLNEAPYDIVLAIEAAEWGLSADQGSSTAIFNLALALERLHLLDAAAQTWNEYLGVDRGGGWAAEARDHLDRLATLLVPASWEQARARLHEAAGRNNTEAVLRVGTNHLSTRDHLHALDVHAERLVFHLGFRV